MWKTRVDVTDLNQIQPILVTEKNFNQFNR